MKYPNQEGPQNFPKGLSSPRELWSSTARNPLSLQEQSEAFVRKEHRHMGPYPSKANYEDTVDPRLYGHKMPQHP